MFGSTKNYLNSELYVFHAKFMLLYFTSNFNPGWKSNLKKQLTWMQHLHHLYHHLYLHLYLHRYHHVWRRTRCSMLLSMVWVRTSCWRCRNHFCQHRCVYLLLTSLNCISNTSWGLSIIVSLQHSLWTLAAARSTSGCDELAASAGSGADVAAFSSALSLLILCMHLSMCCNAIKVSLLRRLSRAICFLVFCFPTFFFLSLCLRLRLLGISRSLLPSDCKLIVYPVARNIFYLC